MLRRCSVVSCFIVTVLAGGCGDDDPVDVTNPAAQAQSSQHNGEGEEPMPQDEEEADAGQGEEEVDAGEVEDAAVEDADDSAQDAATEDAATEDAAAQDAAVTLDGASSEGDAMSMPAANLPCDVEAFFASKCQRCHGPEARNGTPLMNYDNLMATSKRDPEMNVIERVLVRVSDTEKPMPPMGKGDPASEDEIAMLKAWVDGGSVAAECAH